VAAPKAQTAQRRVAPTRTGAARLQVVEMPRRRYPVVAVMSVAVIVVFGSLLISAMVHSMLVSGQAHLDDLGTQIRHERRGLEDDRLRLAEASSPQRLAAEAERIGLVVAERQTWIRPGSDAEPVVTGGDSTPTPATTDGSTDAVSTTDDDRGTTNRTDPDAAVQGEARR